MKKQLHLLLISGTILSLTAVHPLYARGGGGNGSMNGYRNGGGYGNGSSANTSRSGNGFNDADGNGVNDRARDTDGDGTFNGKDADYVRPQDGSGRGATEFQGSGTGTRVLNGTGPHGKTTQTAK